MLTYVALSLVTADPSECTRHSSSRTNCLASGHHGCAWHARAANPSAGTCGEVPQCSERAKGGCPYRQTHGVGGGAAWDASHRECFEHNGICHNASTCFDLDHTECTSHDADSCTKATVCEHPWPLPLQCAERCSLTHDPVENENGLTPANFRPYVEWSLDESEPLVERGPVHTAPDANASNAASAAKGPTAKVSFGTLTGTADDEADAYLGIPFADPPVEDLRWEAPRDWSAAYSGGERDASVYGSTCMQSKVYTPALQMSESCLYLNVWTPAGSSQVQSTVNDTAAALPVMIFIYGGGCSSGSSSLQGYNGAHLAATENVIVVSMNYRVAAFGFLSLQSQADAKETTGNFGLLDQQSALRWVQNEIAAFGGDASRVMLFGESAGSMAVCAHLAMPSSKGLFSAVLMQSRSCTARPLAQGLVGADLSGDAELMAQTKCKDVACLRALSSDKVLSSTASSSWLPVIDGVVIKSDPMVILESGGANTKNVIVGTNTEEGSVFIVRISISLSLLPAFHLFISGSSHSKTSCLVSSCFVSFRLVLLTYFPADSVLQCEFEQKRVHNCAQRSLWHELL